MAASAELRRLPSPARPKHRCMRTTGSRVAMLGQKQTLGTQRQRSQLHWFRRQVLGVAQNMGTAMKCGNRLLSILALSVVPVTAGLATQPAPTQGTKAGSDAHHAQRASKTGVDAQKKTEIPRGTSDQGRRINAARAKEGVEAQQGKAPDAGGGSARNIAATTGITKSARPHGTGAVVGAVGTRSAASISGTDMRLKGTTPAVIHPGGKSGARITGTGIAGKN
jgi:hypothetical protein